MSSEYGYLGEWPPSTSRGERPPGPGSPSTSTSTSRRRHGDDDDDPYPASRWPADLVGNPDPYSHTHSWDPPLTASSSRYPLPPHPPRPPADANLEPATYEPYHVPPTGSYSPGQAVHGLAMPFSDHHPSLAAASNPSGYLVPPHPQQQQYGPPSSAHAHASNGAAGSSSLFGQWVGRSEHATATDPAGDEMEKSHRSDSYSTQQSATSRSGASGGRVDDHVTVVGSPSRGQATGQTGRRAAGSAAAALSAAATSANTHGAKRPSGEDESGAGATGGPPSVLLPQASPEHGNDGGDPSKKLVKKADKSCRKCRDRRVRCDRVFPVCDRCRKRRENCTYVDGVNVDEFEEGGDAQKVVELQARVTSLERQLKTAASSNLMSAAGASGTGNDHSPSSDTNSPGNGNRNQNSSDRRPSGSGSSSGASNSNHGSGQGLAAGGAAGGFVSSSSSSGRTPPSSTSAAGGFSSSDPGLGLNPSIVSSIGEMYSNQLRFKPDEAETLISYLMGDSMSVMNLGRTSTSWRLGEPAFARQLTIHLMDAATHACCSKIPGIKPLADRVDHYKRNLDRLDPAGQCAVAVLSALGARASPHSALLGVATMCLADGTPSPPLFLYAGERREIACRALERRAREVCWVNGMLESSNLADLDAIIGLTQVLIYEEILPVKSRFFTRIAVGMYHDLRFKALEKGERTSRDPRIGPGTALFLADAVISAASSRPSFISTAELETYFISDGVPIPDFPGTNLRNELDKILQQPLDKEKLVDATTSGIIWVSGCSRLFAQLTMTRRATAPSPLPLLKNLWSLIDNVHNSLQHLQSIFVNLDPSTVPDLDDSPYALDYFVLLGVRADSILVDLINLMHVWLTKDRNGDGIWTEREDDPLLASMRHESALRVRKCLKLSAFYAQLFLSSQDKHLVHHMMMQLEILGDWTDWAVQRVGHNGGPPSEEFEVSESELDWFQRALELSCYYTPKAANRLQRLTAARKEEADRSSARLNAQPQPSVPPISLEHVVPSQVLYENPSYQDYDSNDGRPRQSDEHEGMFPLGGGWVSNPSEIFVFDDYGIAAQQGHPLGTENPVSADPIFQSTFRGQNWMDGVQ